MSHTPGPWHYRTVDDSIGSIDDESGEAVAQSLQRPSARTVTSIYKANKERIANAKLIAAAPDLLNELKRILKEEPLDFESYIRVAEIIAKAEGKA